MAGSIRGSSNITKYENSVGNSSGRFASWRQILQGLAGGRLLGIPLAGALAGTANLARDGDLHREDAGVGWSFLLDQAIGGIGFPTLLGQHLQVPLGIVAPVVVG